MPREAPMDKVHRQGAVDFHGTGQDNPVQADKWLHDTRWIMRQMGLRSEDKLSCVLSLLKGNAREWWETVEL